MANSYGAGRSRSVARQGSKDRGVAPVFRKLAAGVCCAAMCACCCVLLLAVSLSHIGKMSTATMLNARDHNGDKAASIFHNEEKKWAALTKLNQLKKKLSDLRAKRDTLNDASESEVQQALDVIEKAVNATGASSSDANEKKKGLLMKLATLRAQRDLQADVRRKRNAKLKHLDERTSALAKSVAAIQAAKTVQGKTTLPPGSKPRLCEFTQGRDAVGAPPPLAYLGIMRPIWPLDEQGHILLPADVRHIAIDVGANKLKVMEAWLLRDPRHAYIGFEPNPFLWGGAIVTGREVAHGKDSVKAAADALTQFVADPGGFLHVPRTSQILAARHDRAFVVNAAAAKDPGWAEFNMGGAWGFDDTGSMYSASEGAKFRLEQAIGATPVRVERLDRLLSILPPPREGGGDSQNHLPFTWGMLKIDAQGADADALVSAAEYIRHFVCVLGEFTEGCAMQRSCYGYTLPPWVEANPCPFLLDHSFIPVLDLNAMSQWIEPEPAEGFGNHESEISFWANARYAKRWASDELYNKDGFNKACPFPQVYDESRTRLMIVASFLAHGVLDAKDIQMKSWKRSHEIVALSQLRMRAALGLKLNNTTHKSRRLLATQVEPGVSTCVYWRQTSECKASGKREPAFDVGCDIVIPADASGYCECENTQVNYDCGHAPLTCTGE